MRSICCVLVATLLVVAASTWAAQKALRVQVRRVVLRDRPNALGTNVGSLDYGAPVTVTGESGDAWRQVTSGGLSGWLRTSAITQKKVTLRKSKKGAKVKASRDELALAGKGMDEAGKSHRKKNKKLAPAYEVVDRMETEALYQSSPDQIIAFLQAGGVTPEDAQ